jgi:hypothetical protein
VGVGSRPEGDREHGIEIGPAQLARLLAAIERLGSEALQLCEEPAIPPAGRAALDRARAAVADRLRDVGDGEALVSRYYLDRATLIAAAERALDGTLLPSAVAVDAAAATRLRELGLAEDSAP